MTSENVYLEEMTRELCHELYRSWENDESIYMDMSLFKPFTYREEAVDRYYDSKQEPSRVLLAIMLGDRPIGEVQLKQVDREKKECTLSIHMQNDEVKGKGYGTEAERLAVKYAFEELGMQAVNADTVVKNVRSQHILDKLGFEFIKEEGDFRYYRLERDNMVLEKSCGAIVFTVDNGEIKYLLVEEISGCYSFPKGHMENEESEEETALREIREETNLDVELYADFRVTERYNPAEKPGVTKEVVYFLGKYTSENPCVVRPDEVKSLKSLSLEDAINIVGYDNKKEFLKQADKYIKEKA